MDYLQIGEIVNSHGVKGELKILPLTDFPERFKEMTSVLVEKDGLTKVLQIQETRYFKKFVLIKAEDIDTAEQADELKGFFLIVDRKDAVVLPPDSFFICDIVGLTVFDENRGLLGVVSEVLQTGSNDVYVVKFACKNDLLIPALKTVVKNVSISEGTIKVLLPKGLIDDEI